MKPTTWSSFPTRRATVNIDRVQYCGCAFGVNCGIFKASDTLYLLGKFLDLHEVYTMFINLKGVERMDYISYITSFDQLYDVPRDRKGGEYRKYLAALLDYLWSFMTRTRPLLDLEVEIGGEVLKDFDSKFERGELPGWAREQVGPRFRFSSRFHTFLFRWEQWPILELILISQLSPTARNLPPSASIGETF